MTQDKGLFGESFDQQRRSAGSDIAKRDITPNRRVPGEIVFEPIGSSVRVTARDSEHRVLWGYIGAKETVRQIHCLVAVYDTLQQMLAEELEKCDPVSPDSDNPLTAAQAALARLEGTTKWLKESLEVKKVSEATLQRARAIARIVADADRQIALEAETLKGMKSRSEQPAAGDA